MTSATRSLTARGGALPPRLLPHVFTPEEGIPMNLRCQMRVAMAVFGLVLLGLTGCGGGGSSIEGEVTYNGEPVDGGISFVSSDGSTGEGASAGEDIREGKYSIPYDRGLKPGKYKVEIYGKT